MKKNLRIMAAAFLFVLLSSLAFCPAQAAYGLTQSNPGADTITLSWTPKEKAVAYHVYVGEGYDSLALNQDLPASAAGTTITGLLPGREYYVQVKYDEISAYSGKVNTNTVGSGDFRTLPARVENVHQTKWWYFLKAVDVEWDRQTGADGYEYQLFNDKGKMIEAQETTGANMSQGGISNSMVYRIQVRSYATICGTKYYGDWSEQCYCFTQPRIRSAKTKGGKINIKWDKVSGATGYDVYVSVKPKQGYKKVRSVGKNVTSISVPKFKGKKISSKKKYYVYIATVKKVGGNKNTSGALYYWNTKDSRYGYF